MRTLLPALTAILILSNTAGCAPASAALSETQQKRLLGLARATVEAHVSGKELPPAFQSDPAFKEPRAVFVTIRKNGELRGCIGRILAEGPLADQVRRMAVEAASRDPRFQPVTAPELKDLTYEVSVLSAPEKVADAGAIEMGRHGVILRQAGHDGVFLPKVAEELDWDKEEFLGELCSQKAALPRDCWQDPRTEILVFTAQEFSENG